MLVELLAVRETLQPKVTVAFRYTVTFLFDIRYLPVVSKDLQLVNIISNLHYENGARDVSTVGHIR